MSGRNLTEVLQSEDETTILGIIAGKTVSPKDVWIGSGANRVHVAENEIRLFSKYGTDDERSIIINKYDSGSETEIYTVDKSGQRIGDALYFDGAHWSAGGIPLNTNFGTGHEEVARGDANNSFMAGLSAPLSSVDQYKNEWGIFVSTSPNIELVKENEKKVGLKIKKAGWYKFEMMQRGKGDGNAYLTIVNIPSHNKLYSQYDTTANNQAISTVSGFGYLEADRIIHAGASDASHFLYGNNQYLGSITLQFLHA